MLPLRKTTYFFSAAFFASSITSFALVISSSLAPPCCAPSTWSSSFWRASVMRWRRGGKTAFVSSIAARCDALAWYSKCSRIMKWCWTLIPPFPHTTHDISKSNGGFNLPPASAGTLHSRPHLLRLVPSPDALLVAASPCNMMLPLSQVAWQRMSRLRVDLVVPSCFRLVSRVVVDSGEIVEKLAGLKARVWRVSFGPILGPALLVRSLHRVTHLWRVYILFH